MGQIKLIKRNTFLTAGALAGCLAGSAVASTPVPSVLPTAPVMPAFQAVIEPGSGSGFSSPIGYFYYLPVFGAGGYEPIPTLSTHLYLSNFYSSATTYISSASTYLSTGYIYPSYPQNITATTLVSNPYTYPMVINNSVTITPSQLYSPLASGSGYFPGIGYPYTYGGSYTNGITGLIDWGSGGYNWLKITTGGVLNTDVSAPKLPMPQQITSMGTYFGTVKTYAASSGTYAYGTFIGTTLLSKSELTMTRSPADGGYEAPTGYQTITYKSNPDTTLTQYETIFNQFLNLGGPATGYGVVNVDGGTWNDADSPVFIGYGGQGFVTVQSSGKMTLSSEGLIVGEDSAGLPTATGGYASANSDVSYSIALPHLAAGIGTVVVESGGTVTSTGSGGYIALGRSVSASGATGNLYVTGAGSSISVSQGILVGDGGYGFLAVLSGGQVASGSSYAAGGAKSYGVTSQPGSANIVIDGVSSSWAISGNADFGETGVATATVQNYGNLNISGTLTLGDQSTGSGTLTLQADGTIQSGAATLGNQAGATGFANVSNINTLWTVDGDLTVGNSGQGTLTLSNNGEVITTGDGVLGSQTGSTGTATITDAGTEWQINGELKVGDKGDGTMSVENGGLVSVAGNVAIAESGGTSTLTLDGNGSRLTASGTSVTIGGQGDGTLIVQNAADAVVSGAGVSLGEQTTGTGTLTVQGSNTIMSAGSLTIGGYGTGTLNVQDSASLSTGTNISLGEQASGTGTATIDSAAVNDAGSLTVGGYGTGTMTIQDGGSLTVQGNSVTLGEQNGGSGTLNIIGSGSSLMFSGDMTVGESGGGDFELQNGGQFGGVSMTVGGGTGFGGASTGGSGTVEISGAGSSLSLSQDLTVGKYGQGTVTLAGGGSLIDQGDVTLGSVTASNGTVNVNSGSDWQVSGSLSVGSKGYGTVVVNGGSNLKSTGDSITIGKQGAGELTVSGSKSGMTYTGDLAIGDEATGTLNVQNGAGIQYSGNTSNVDIAETAGITGTVAVTGSGSSLAANNLVLAGKSSGSGGNGILNVENGGVLTVANAMTMWKNASLNVTGGSITVGTAGSGAAPLNTLEVNTDGNLVAGGTITGNLVNNQGVIALGKVLPESLNVTGGFSQSGGILKVLIAGSSDFSQLNTTGAVNFSGGTIEFDFINGFAPTSGESFQFLDPPQAVSIANTAYTFTGLASGFLFSVAPNANGLMFTANANGVATSSPIPEPAADRLLLVSLAAMAMISRRKNMWTTQRNG